VQAALRLSGEPPQFRGDGEVIDIIEGSAFDDVVVQWSPEAFDLAKWLPSVGPGVSTLDDEEQADD